MSGLDQNTLMRQDYFALRRAKRGASTDAKVAASQALLAQRQLLAQQLNLTPMSGLPVSDAAAQITAAIAEHPVVIIAGETGSGKTTQLPKFCLQNGLGLTGTIAHTQPRRIAARTVAQRIAHEVGTELGEAVGYSVRFSDRSNPQSLLRVMTDGLLLTEIRRDRYLNAYDAIIV
ncbi:MAG TPA: ATP-dependent helicase, partial [Gammaproteobacteria bacterium]|nr:ATP-dependent helicase [Gammaproteobacteria bacterium]